MDFEEKLEQLKKRDDTVSRAVQLFLTSSREQWERLGAQRREAENQAQETQAQIGQTDAKIRSNTESIDKLLNASAALLHADEANERWHWRFRARACIRPVF
jgi:hypothetical protein